MHRPGPTTPHSLAKGERLAQRLAHMIALLHEGEDLDKHRLADTFGVDVRTIERDLAERLASIACKDDAGRWRLAGDARRTIPTRQLRDYADLTGVHALFPDDSMAYLLEQVRIPERERPVRVQPAAGEDLRERRAVFQALHAAIRQRRLCRFDYKARGREVQPYKLIHRHGVWYLAAVEAGQPKSFSVALLGALEVDDRPGFEPDPAHARRFDAADDIWFAGQTTEVLLRVAPEAARFFARRPLLPRQQHRADRDGSLIVSTQIDHPQQLLPVVRYWLPHVRILRPVALHEELVASLRDALARLDPAPPSTTLTTAPAATADTAGHPQEPHA